LVYFLLKNLNPDDIFYDIGANVGYYTYLSGLLCKEVHVFEPIKEYIDLIKENIVEFKNTNFFINNLALSDHKGKIKIFLNSGKSTIIKKKQTF